MICLKMKFVKPVWNLAFRRYLVYRQPFPGPGLGIRIIGEVTAEKVQDGAGSRRYLPRRDCKSRTATERLAQYFAALTNMRSVGVMGDERTYDYASCAESSQHHRLYDRRSCRDSVGRAVAKLCTSRIVNEVKHVNRVLYDLHG